MSKPDDIPQSVLAVAEEDYQQAIYMTTSDEPQNMVFMVARAIMAERERCARVADTYFMRWENDGSAYWLERRMHSEEIAAAIRKGTP